MCISCWASLTFGRVWKTEGQVGKSIDCEKEGSMIFEAVVNVVDAI